MKDYGTMEGFFEGKTIGGVQYNSHKGVATVTGVDMAKGKDYTFRQAVPKTVLPSESEDTHGQSHIRFVNRGELPTEQELFGQEVAHNVHKTVQKDDYKRRIETHLEQECYQLLDVLPESLHDGFHTLYIAGGSIYSLYNQERVNDYDFFGRDEAYLLQLRGFFSQFVEYSSQYIQRGEYQGFKVMLTDNAITIGRWQIITNWFGSPEEVTGQFDFKHTMNWYDGSLHTPLGTEYLESEMLWYNEDRARDFAGTLLRIPHFVSNGFHIRKSEHCKILQKLNDAGFNDKDLKTMETYLDY